jgi:hypothetical protein
MRGKGKLYRFGLQEQAIVAQCISCLLYCDTHASSFDLVLDEAINEGRLVYLMR